MAVVVCSSLTVEYKKMLMRRISSLLVCSVHARVHVRVCMRIHANGRVCKPAATVVSHKHDGERYGSPCVFVHAGVACEDMRTHEKEVSV